MDFSQYIIPSLWLLGITSTCLLVVRNWRVLPILLGIQYVGVFVLVGTSWPIEMAVVKLVVGWLSAAMLGLELGKLKPSINKEIVIDGVGFCLFYCSHYLLFLEFSKSHQNLLTVS